jgi:BirA family transcriptional regulator, biotin operon repressor / biotin---[acetyl-CoA-carboxylase] ligase
MSDTEKSNTENYLLKKLSESGFHGGDKLGEDLGISRVAISKHMSSLRGKGLPLISVPGKGYCLEDGVELLHPQKILDAVNQKRIHHITEIHIHQQLDSTNQWLLEQAFVENRASVCLAESQLAGRGRRDRQWHSSPYRNLMYSLSWRFSNWPSSLSAVSLLAGLVVAEALEISGVPDVQIKWPNDIYLNGKKLGGLLVSAKGEASGACDLVVGVGINHHILPAEGSAIDQEWIDLSSQKLSVNRNQLTALITEGFIDLLPEFEQKGFAPFRDAWNTRCIFLDQKVRLFKGMEDSSTEENTDELIGICRGVDNEGVLQIEKDDGSISSVRDADLSMRALSDSTNAN